MSVTYICANGHERESHRTQPAGHDKKAVCRECKADIVRRSVPMYDCEDCGYRWAYKGDAESPTCPSCAGKHTVPVDE